MGNIQKETNKLALILLLFVLRGPYKFFFVDILDYLSVNDARICECRPLIQPFGCWQTLKFQKNTFFSYIQLDSKCANHLLPASDWSSELTYAIIFINKVYYSFLKVLVVQLLYKWVLFVLETRPTLKYFCSNCTIYATTNHINWTIVNCDMDFHVTYFCL